MPDDAYTIDVDTTDAVEMGPVPDGEYKVQVISAEYREGIGQTSGNAWAAVFVTLDLPEEEASDYVNYSLWLPTNDMDAKRKNRTLGKVKAFKEAFEIGDDETFTAESLQGMEAWAFLKTRDEEDYGMQNYVSKWVAPA